MMIGVASSDPSTAWVVELFEPPLKFLKYFLNLLGTVLSDKQLGWNAANTSHLMGAPLSIFGAIELMSVVDVDIFSLKPPNDL